MQSASGWLELRATWERLRVVLAEQRRLGAWKYGFANASRKVGRKGDQYGSGNMGFGLE